MAQMMVSVSVVFVRSHSIDRISLAQLLFVAEAVDGETLESASLVVGKATFAVDRENSVVEIDCAAMIRMVLVAVVDQVLWLFVAAVVVAVVGDKVNEVVDGTENEVAGMVTTVVDDMVTLRVADTVTVVDSDMVNWDSDSSTNCSPSPEIEVVCIDRSRKASCFYC